MIPLILEVMKAGLPVLDKLIPSEGERIRKLVYNYEKEFNEELAKGENRNDARLDTIERELRDIFTIFCSTLASATPANK